MNLSQWCVQNAFFAESIGRIIRYNPNSKSVKNQPKMTKNDQKSVKIDQKQPKIDKKSIFLFLCLLQFSLLEFIIN